MSANSPQTGHCSQTAPIREYRVMWTQQKRQKLKKWHDGTMRFHTFNNRMLLYDESRTLITDKYLKPGATIGEGDEVEFEQHLATIEEFLQTVIQDLAPVFAPHLERQQQRAARNATSPARQSNVPSPVSRTTTPARRRPTPQTPIRTPYNPQTPQSLPPMYANPAKQVQLADTPAPANRISAPLPLPGSSLHQLAPPPTGNPPAAAQPPRPRPPNHTAPVVEQLPVQPNRLRPPPPPRFLPPRPQPDPAASLPAPPHEPPGRKRPVPPELAPAEPAPRPPTLCPCPAPPPQSERRSPAKLAEPPPSPPRAQSSTTPPELATIRLSDPYRRRSKLQCPPRRPGAETPAQAPQCPPSPSPPSPPPPPQTEAAPPPQKKARTAAAASTATTTATDAAAATAEQVLMDSDLGPDPFDLAFSPHDQVFALDPPAPATKPYSDFQSARTALSGPAAEGEKNREGERERGKAGRRFVTRKQNTFNDSGPWGGDSGDLFERGPTSRRGGG